MRFCAARIGLLPLALSALSATGCLGTMAKQAFNEMRGARGEVLPVSEPREAALARVEGIEFTPATTTAGGRICPPELLRAYDRSVNQLLVRLKPLYPGGSPVLKVDSEVLYFQKKGLTSGAILLTRTRMHDDGQLAADAIVKVESDAFRAGGEEQLTQAAADALRKFFEKQKRPERNERPERSERSERRERNK